MGQKLKIEYDMEEMFMGLKEAIKSELRPEIADEIREEIKTEIKADIMERLKSSIPDETAEYLKGIMREIYDNEVVVVGGGWDKAPEEYSLKDYIIAQTKERIVNNNCGSKKSYSHVSFSEWFRDECVSADIEKIINKEIKEIRADINMKVKTMFDSETKEMLSATVLNMLMANDTYKKIESNISSIASKQNNV